jgi:hypothetical protein
LYACRGTKAALREQLLLWLGMDAADRCCHNTIRKVTCSTLPLNCGKPETPPRWSPPPLILEHFQLRRWLFLGSGRLGEQAVLWGQRIVNRSQLDENARIGATQLNTVPDPLRDPFHVYAHRFSVFVPACYQHDAGKKKALEQLIAAEHPAHTKAQLEFVEPRFRIAVQSCIGFDSVIGSYPKETRLRTAAAALGTSSVVSGTPRGGNGGAMTVGNRSRIGTTTRLN